MLGQKQTSAQRCTSEQYPLKSKMLDLDPFVQKDYGQCLRYQLFKTCSSGRSCEPWLWRTPLKSLPIYVSKSICLSQQFPGQKPLYDPWGRVCNLSVFIRCIFTRMP